MQSAKETASNVAASAKAGMDKTTATMQEKAEKMTTRDPLQKEMATQKKLHKIDEAELKKQEARVQNAAEKHGAHAGHHTTTGTGTAPYSTPGATGLPTGNVNDGLMGSHQVGKGTGTGGTTAHDPTMRADVPRHADRDPYI